MKRKSSSRKLTIFGAWTLGFIVVAGVLAGVASGEQFKIYTLDTTGINNDCTLPDADPDIAGCQTVVNEQIYCKIKQTTEIVDNQNNVVGTEQSPFFAGNPITTFEITDESSSSDITEGGFLVTAKIKCASDANAITKDIFKDNDQFEDADFHSYPSVKIPLKVKDGSLLVKVYSKDSNGVEHETFNANLSFDELVLTDPTEKNLGELKIGSDRILVFIPAGEYNSQQRIALSGNIDIVWRDFPSVNYRLHIDESDIPTFREVTVIKSTEPEPIKCADNEIKQGNICVKPTSTPQPTDSPTVTTLNEFQEATLCIQNGDFACLLQDKFIPYIIAGVGGLFLLGAVTHNSAPKFNAMGYPMR